MKISMRILVPVLIMKLCFLFYAVQYQGTFSDNNFVDRFTTNDYSSLLGPVNNLIQTGNYELIKYSEFLIQKDFLVICFHLFYLDFF